VFTPSNVRTAVDTQSVKNPSSATEPFGVVLRRLLTESNLSGRALAREIGRFDHAYLVRMMQGKLPVNLDHARAIQQHLGLPPDYFAEIREAAVHDLIDRDPHLRDEIYFSRVRRGRR
jgi:transcriptional regulator with XRE-family HTH domain